MLLGASFFARDAPVLTGALVSTESRCAIMGAAPAKKRGPYEKQAA